MTFAEMLRTEREKRGDSLRDVARRIGCSEGHIRNVASGSLLPSVVLARRLAEALGADPFTFELALAMETGRLEFDPEAIDRAAVARAITELRARGR